jgi:hypothetical protein
MTQAATDQTIIEKLAALKDVKHGSNTLYGALDSAVQSAIIALSPFREQAKTNLAAIYNESMGGAAGQSAANSATSGPINDIIQNLYRFHGIVDAEVGRISEPVPDESAGSRLPRIPQDQMPGFYSLIYHILPKECESDREVIAKALRHIGIGEMLSRDEITEKLPGILRKIEISVQPQARGPG